MNHCDVKISASLSKLLFHCFRSFDVLLLGLACSTSSAWMCESFLDAYTKFFCRFLCCCIAHVAKTIMYLLESHCSFIVVVFCCHIPHLTFSSSCYIHGKNTTFWHFNLDIKSDCSAALGDPQAVLVAAEYPPLKLHLGDAKQVEGR